MIKTISFLFIIFSLNTYFAFCDDEHDHDHEGHGHEDHSHVDHNFHTGVLLGYSANLNGGHKAFALGLEQEYVFSEKFPGFGIGFHSEIVFADHKEYVLALAFLMNPMERLHLGIGPGVIFHTHEDEDHDEMIRKKFKKDILLSGENDSESETTFLITTGLHYDFHYDFFTISPALEFHFFEGKTDMTIGLVIGIVY